MSTWAKLLQTNYTKDRAHIGPNFHRHSILLTDQLGSTFTVKLNHEGGASVQNSHRQTIPETEHSGPKFHRQTIPETEHSGPKFHRQTIPETEHLGPKFHRQTIPETEHSGPKFHRQTIILKIEHLCSIFHGQTISRTQHLGPTYTDKQQPDPIFKNNLYRRQSTWVQLSQTNYTIDIAPGQELAQLSRKNFFKDSASVQNSHI